MQDRYCQGGAIDRFSVADAELHIYNLDKTICRMTKNRNLSACLALVVCLGVAHAQLPTTIAVSSQNPSLMGTPVNLTATVTSPNGPVTQGSVVFDNGGSPCALTGVNLDSNGEATCPISFGTSGPNNVKVIYQPNDSTYAGSTVTYVQIMEWFQTLALESSGSPSTAGSSVTFTTVFGNVQDCAGGPVDFFDNGAYIGTAPILPPYQAQFSTSILSAGEHTITASWLGYPFCQDATSAPLAQVVQDGATVSLTSSASPVQFLNPVMLTSSVSGAGGTPTGSVNFYDGDKLLNPAPVPLQSGVGKLSVALGIGKHTLVAQYPGGGAVASGLSSSITVYRSPKPH